MRWEVAAAIDVQRFLREIAIAAKLRHPHILPLLDSGEVEYALGCVAYEMLAGEPPFSGATAQAVIARHFHERVPSLRVVRPTTAPATQRVLETAMAKVPADRYSTASDMAQALATSMRGGTSLGRRVALGALAVAVIAVPMIV